MISDGNETLSMQIRTLCEQKRMNRNAQGMISDGNETLSMQKRTSCKQKRAGDDQRRE